MLAAGCFHPIIVLVLCGISNPLTVASSLAEGFLVAAAGGGTVGELSQGDSQHCKCHFCDSAIMVVVLTCILTSQCNKRGLCFGWGLVFWFF